MADSSKALAQALDLPVRERLRIAGALLRSVHPEADDDAADAWISELERRSAADPAELVEGAAAHARVREVLRQRRARR